MTLSPDFNLKCILHDLLVNVDEDCPSEFRSKHLRMAMAEASEILKDFKFPSPWHDTIEEENSDG